MTKTPIFVSDHSLGDSILTLSKDIWVKIEEEKEGKKVQTETTEPDVTDGKPISIFAIAKKHELSQVILVDSSMSSFWEAYESARKLGIQLIYGVKLAVAEDLSQKDDDSRKTESSVIIFANNTQGYYDLLPIYSQSTVEGGYYHPRTDWKNLNLKWTANLSLAFPFYSSFIARNIMKFENRAMPDYRKLGRPMFFVEEHGLPFDKTLKTSLEKYAAEQGLELTPTQTCYYYKRADALAYQTLKCIKNQSVRSKPNLDHFAVDTFCFENL